ncbi:hypothetical protein EC973_005781 [Apophysomyces ossiformis]|uniref:Uncharacterized protein n=1 Tax=Apophysomyces ossiformis TaxID=679940 RepID=A0A8H7BF10_9FUNG|nr:hypothetical protein EC973_005781 [Apophysomyces ossiformis]
MSQSHNQRFAECHAVKEVQTGTQLSLPVPVTDKQLTLAVLSCQVINVEDELKELSQQQQLNAERLHNMLVETNTQIALLGEMQRDHSSAFQSTDGSSQAVNRRIAGPQNPKILKFEERFNSAHNCSVTEKVERYVLGKPLLIVNPSSLHGKICQLFNNQKQSKNCSAEKKDVMRIKAWQQRRQQEHRAAVVEEFGEDSGNILAKQLMSEEESEDENSLVLVVQKLSWQSSKANAFYARLDQLAVAERMWSSAMMRQKVVVLKDLPVLEAFSTTLSTQWRHP